MDTRLIALKLVLDELGVPSDIDTIDDRKRVQKAIYLGQLTGVDLSYRFGWYLMGPYSPALTRDYFNLAEAVASEEDEYENYSLSEALRNRLSKIRPIMEVPEGVDLQPENWLELLASLHYLIKVRGLDEEAAESELRDKKSHVAAFINEAKERLEEAGLLSQAIYGSV